MASRKSLRKVVRTESLLDEYRIYFSHVFSPLRNRQKQKNAERTSAAQLQRQHDYGSKDVDEDIDAKSELRKNIRSLNSANGFPGNSHNFCSSSTSTSTGQGLLI